MSAIAFAISAGHIQGFLAFVLVLCAMVVIHEFGHFIVAKMLGIAVETFSVGFGPRLFGFQIGETDYRFSAIPLGGYVKFRGENMEMLQGKTEGSIDEFLSHAKWKRFLVAVAGPVFNIVTALLIPAAAIMIGFQERAEMAQQPVVGRVQTGSPAEKAGLLPGDRILTYYGDENPAWQDINMDIMLRPGEPIPLKIERNGQQMELILTPGERKIEGERIGESGIEPYIGLNQLRVLSVATDLPAGKAGLLPGDKITSINGKAITAWHQFKGELAGSNGQPVTLKVLRAEKSFDLQAAPVMSDGEYRLGFRPELLVPVKTTSVLAALKFGVDYNWRLMKLTGILFKQIFAGQRSARKAVGGPIRIAEQTISTYREVGWSGVIELMGMLSLNLGVFNLLPIPVLDGGVIMMIFVEWIFGLIGLSLTMNIRERVQQVGFVMVLLLMGFVIINDVIGVGEKIFSKSPPPMAAQEQPAASPQPAK